MTIFDRIKRFFALSLIDPKAWDRSLWSLYGSQSLSGEVVTEQTALTYSAVYNAVSLISGTIATLPLHLMQRKGDKKRIADDRKLYQVMHDQWNPYMTAVVGREVLMAHVLLWGNGYAEKVRNGYGDIIELWPITPDRCRPKMQAGELVYEIRMDREAPITLPRDKILHIPGLGFDGFIGYSVIAMARKSLGLSMAMETFGSRFFGNGTHPSAVITHPHALKDPKAMRDAITDVYGGLGKSHLLMLLEHGMDIKFPSLPAKDSQFLESRQFQIPEVARWFNLPPHKLKDLTRSSFSNIESEQISFVTDSILPWLVRLEANYNTQLLTSGDRGLYGQGRLYFKHSVEGLMRGDAASRATFYGALLDRGVLSINEVRELEDKDPVEGGDIHLVPLNFTTLENAGKPPVSAPATATPAPEPSKEKMPTPNPKKEKALLEVLRR